MPELLSTRGRTGRINSCLWGVFIAGFLSACSATPFDEDAENDANDSDWVEVGEVFYSIYDLAFDGDGNVYILSGDRRYGQSDQLFVDDGDGFEMIAFGVENVVRRLYPETGAGGEVYIKLENVDPVGGSTMATIRPLRTDAENSPGRFVLADDLMPRFDILLADSNGTIYVANVFDDEPVLAVDFQFSTNIREREDEPWGLLPDSLATGISNFDGSMWLSIPDEGLWRVSANGESARHVVSCPSEELTMLCEGAPRGLPLLGHGEGHIWVAFPDRFVLIDENDGQVIGELPATPSAEFPVPGELRTAHARDGSIYLEARTAISPGAPGMLFKGELGEGWTSVVALESDLEYFVNPHNAQVYRWESLGSIDRWDP